VGYDDYEMLDVWGRARALAERDLRSVGWLLGLMEAVSTVDRLRKDICKFLSGQHGRGSESNSTASIVRSTVSIQSDEERRRLQKRQANNYRMIVLQRQLEECRREILRRGDGESSMGEFVSQKNSEKDERWKHNVVPQSNSGRANSDEDFGGPLVAAIWKKPMSMSDGAPMADTE
jgi:hypothetical protein